MVQLPLIPAARAPGEGRPAQVCAGATGPWARLSGSPVAQPVLETMLSHSQLHMHFPLSFGAQFPRKENQGVNAPWFYLFFVLVSWFNLMVLKLRFSIVIRTLEL